MSDIIELACRELVFHFNKAHLQDPTIPMWVLKTKGRTFYIDHVDANIPWSTKETKDNPHTKGSIKFKNCLCTIDEDNCATLTVLTDEDKIRLDEVEKEPSIIWYEGYSPNIEELLTKHNIKHQGVLKTNGACTTDKQMAGIYNDSDLCFIKLMIPKIRILNENESYYRMYKKWVNDDKSSDYLDEDSYYEDDEDNEPNSLRWTNPKKWKELFK